MNYEEYVNKHKKILEPISEKMGITLFLGLLEMIGEEFIEDNGFRERLSDFISKEKETLFKSEIKEAGER